MTFLLVEAEIFYLTRFERTDDFAAAIQQLVIGISIFSLDHFDWMCPLYQE